MRASYYAIRERRAELPERNSKGNPEREQHSGATKEVYRYRTWQDTAVRHTLSSFELVRRFDRPSSSLLYKTLSRLSVFSPIFRCYQQSSKAQLAYLKNTDTDRFSVTAKLNVRTIQPYIQVWVNLFHSINIISKALRYHGKKEKANICRIADNFYGVALQLIASQFFFLCMYDMYIILTPRRVASFFERFSPFAHTILYRYRLINRCQPVPVRFSRPKLVAPHLESALDEQLSKSPEFW